MSDLAARARHKAERMQRRGTGGRSPDDLAIRGFCLVFFAGADVSLGLSQPARDGVARLIGMRGGNGAFLRPGWRRAIFASDALNAD